MGQITSVGEIYGVEVDGADWPKSLPVGEREVLIALVREVIQRWQAVGKHPGTYDLYQQVKHAAEKRDDVPTFRSAALLDWLYACVVRAARAADAEQVWSLPRPFGERWVTFKLGDMDNGNVGVLSDALRFAFLRSDLPLPRSGSSKARRAAIQALVDALGRLLGR